MTDRSDGRWCTSADHASPQRYADAFTGGVSGASIAPGNRSGGQWCDSTSVTSKAPNRIGSPEVATTRRSSGSPYPRPTLAADCPPTSRL